MTAEVAILNKSAVALAADSAVTVSVIPNEGAVVRRKIYANANKLFELIKGQSVGIMLYDSADLLGVPWETLIKMYRLDRGATSFARLTDYSDDFLGFIGKNLDDLIPREVREEYVTFLVYIFATQTLENCRAEILQKAEKGEARINNNLRRRVLEGALQQLESSWLGHPVQGWSDGLSERDLETAYGDKVMEAIPDHLDQYRLNQTHRRKLRSLAFSALLRIEDPPIETGLVFAGFGQRDVFPSVLHLTVGGVILDRLVITNAEASEVSVEQPSIIHPFAQTGEASTFLFGIDPEVKGAVQTFWMEWIGQLPDVARRILVSELPSDLTDDQVDRFVTRLKKFGDTSWRRFAQYMNQLHERSRYKPIEQSAAFLAKGEIAALAENLIDLASLRNRVSIDRDETVGGAIDVAVISKGDGFVWIKRKHYFDLALNPAWASRSVPELYLRSPDVIPVHASEEG